MKAVITSGSTLRLTEHDVPPISADQVLVRTRAAAFNNADVSTGFSGSIPGWEFSGVVESVGSAVDRALVGTPVMGTAPRAFAEFVVAHHRHVLRMPDGVPFAEAAALPTGLLTGQGALTAAEVGDKTTGGGCSVLITGATSGLGLVAVQMAKVLGAFPVIATTRSPAKRDLLERVGADHAVVIGEDDLFGSVLAATGALGVDVVLDHVGGEMLADYVGATRDHGIVIGVGTLSGSSGAVKRSVLVARDITLRNVMNGFTPPEEIGDLLDGLAPRILPAITDGRIRAVIDQVFLVSAASEALNRLRSGQARGKVVLLFDRED